MSFCPCAFLLVLLFTCPCVLQSMFCRLDSTFHIKWIYINYYQTVSTTFSYHIFSRILQGEAIINRSTALEANSEIEKLKTKINEILQELENSKKEMISIKSSAEKEKNNFTAETAEMYARTSLLTSQVTDLTQQQKAEIEAKEKEIEMLKTNNEKEMKVLKDKITSGANVSSMQREALRGELGFSYPLSSFLLSSLLLFSHLFFSYFSSILLLFLLSFFSWLPSLSLLVSSLFTSIFSTIFKFIFYSFFLSLSLPLFSSNLYPIFLWPYFFIS